MTMTVEITSAAQAAVLADERAARAAEPLAAARIALDKVRARIEALHGARQAIIARRQGGDEQPDDGSRLALIAADAEGLAELHTEVQAAVTDAEPAAVAAQEAAARARSLLARAELLETDRAITEHAVELERLLLVTIGKCNASANQLGLPYSKYVAGPGLIKALRDRAIRSGAW